MRLLHVQSKLTDLHMAVKTNS